MFFQRSTSTEAIDLLERDHDDLKKMFKTYEEAEESAPATRRTIFQQIRDELIMHTIIEEEIFYPAVKALANEDAHKMQAEGEQEHALLKQLLAELDRLDPKNDEFQAKMKVLKDLTTHHNDEEEKDLFKKCKSEMSSEQREDIGAEMDERKQDLQEQLAAGKKLQPAPDMTFHVPVPARKKARASSR